MKSAVSYEVFFLPVVLVCTFLLTSS